MSELSRSLLLLLAIFAIVIGASLLWALAPLGPMPEAVEAL